MGLIKMKLAFLLSAFVAAQDERTKAPLVRLSLIEKGLNEWTEAWLPNFKKKEFLRGKLENIIGRIGFRFGWKCAIQKIDKNVEDELDEEIESVLGGDVRTMQISEAVPRMKKYIRVMKRVNRVYLPNCKKTPTRATRADWLGKRYEDGFKKVHGSVHSTGL